MREYIRHPTDISIDYELADVVANQKEYLNNLSEGGLSFKSLRNLGAGTVIHIRIPLRAPVFEEDGLVVWCRKDGDSYEIGIKFTNPTSEFRLRMVEQVCHIEHYKREVKEKEGRDLTGGEAAMEWIRKYAKDFPS